MYLMRCNLDSFCLRVVVLLLACCSHSIGQTAHLPTDSLLTRPAARIRLILVQGNEKTKEEIILREMKLKPGDALDFEEMERDRLRIQNLGIFNRVEIDVVPTNSGAILVVSVSEMWYIFPYPIIFRNERDWSRLSVGAGLLYTNFRGRREVIDVSGWLGFNPAVRLAYTNPWVLGQLKLYTKVSLFARRVRNRSFTVLDSVVNENQIGVKWTIGKRFGHFTFLDVSFGYRQLTLSPRDIGATLSASGRDRLVSLGASLRYDSRDLWEYAHRGHYLNIWATKTGWPGNTIDYLRYGVDLRKYVPLGKTTLAFRAAANLSDGTIPLYEQVHFGFLTRIRGHFRERSSGENLMVGSAEFRLPILPITYHDWGPFQSMGTYGTNFRFGIGAGLFVDTGSIWFQGQNPGKDNFISGWGAGVHFFLPYNGLIRLEYAFDEDWDGQIVVDALMTF
ncbi:MAG: outer membrane protein assembly factor [bacterium]